MRLGDWSLGSSSLMVNREGVVNSGAYVDFLRV